MKNKKTGTCITVNEAEWGYYARKQIHWCVHYRKIPNWIQRAVYYY